MADAYLTLADLAKRQKYGGGIDDIIEVLSETNPILKDAPAVEGNLPTGNRTTQRTSQPTGTLRGINEGVETQKSTTAQFDDACALIEDWSAIDEEEIRIAGDKARYRATEDDAFVAGMTMTFANNVFYGNSLTNPKAMHGLTPRFNSLSGSTSAQIINAGGTGSDNTSVWIIKWSPVTAHLIYPKGTQAGLVTTDLGKIPWTISSKHLMAWVTQFVWHIGLAVRDSRYVARVCNIDLSDLTADASSVADLLHKMLDAYYTVPSADIGKMTKTFVYCGKTVAKFLHKQAMNKFNVNLTLETVAGKPVTNFMGAPVHICDAIKPTPSALTTYEDLVS